MGKRIVVWVIAVMFFAGSLPAFAANEGKGPNPSKAAYEHASDKAKFKRAEELKDKEAQKAAKIAEKESKKAEKEVAKAKQQAEKEAKKKQKELEKKAKKKQKEMEREAKKLKKGLAT